MKLHVFDLDDTLLCGDSEGAWINFLSTKGFFVNDDHASIMNQFELDYRSGNFDSEKYCLYILKSMQGLHEKELSKLSDEFIEEYFDQLVDQVTFNLLDRIEKEDLSIIATGAMDFLGNKFSGKFGIQDCIATKTEIINNKISGKLDGSPNFGIEKKANVEEWCKRKSISKEEIIFYTDSINDFPLVELSPKNVIVSPDDKLEKFAQENKLEIIYR
jgi:HAD superfamily phosphoserine phosphatase-like hydrolase